MEKYYISWDEFVHIPQECNKELMREFLASFTMGREYLVVTDAPENTIFIGNCSAELSDGEFTMNVSSDGIAIAGRNYAAMMRGFTTLLESIEYDSKTDSFFVECGETIGSPSIAMRSVHLCVFPETTLTYLRKCVRTCAIEKVTHIIIEFWGMIKYDVMPELSWKIAYTKDQIRLIIEEANALGVEIIPMFNHLGHASMSRGAQGKHVVLDNNPKLGYMFRSAGWEWNFEDERVLNVLRACRKELMELCGPGSYFHLGCDEAYSLCHANKGAEMSAYLNGIEAELESEGRRGIIWGDMLIPDNLLPGEYTALMHNYELADTYVGNLSKGLIIADWQYGVSAGPWKSTLYFRELGFDVIVCPWSNHANIGSAAMTAEDKSIGCIGMMETTWHLLHQHFPDMVYACRRMWFGENVRLPYDSADLQRKALFVDGDVDEAGWSYKQTGPGFN